MYAWGSDNYGQLGNGETTGVQDEPVKVKKLVNQTEYDLTDIVYIDAGIEHSLAIDKYGNIWVWGRNQFGQLGLGDTIPREHATQQ